MIKRRTLQLACGLLVLAGSLCAAGKPNILFVLSDDQSVPDLGCYGNESLRTPHLDALAAEGMRMDFMFTTAPQCVPSRASLMTGMSPVAARITRFSSALPESIVTLPELLREQGGYYTGISRRYYHLDGPKPKRMTPFLLDLYERHGLQTFSERVDYLEMNGDRELAPKVFNEFLDQVPEGKPWFMWVNFNDPHDTWEENAWSDRIDRETIKVPGYLPDLPEVREDLARHFGEIDRLDEEYSWLVKILQERGLTENTVVIFMGDNGNSVIRGKGTLYDEGLRVPFMVRWPGKIEPGSSSSHLLSGEDLAPTLLEIAGVKAPEQMTGRSFLKLLLGQTYEPRTHIFAERGPHGYAPFTPETKSNSYDLSRAVRSERYKLIYNCTPWIEFAPCMDGLEDDEAWAAIVKAHENGTLAERFVRMYFTTPRPIYQLFDLENDPLEINNLSGQSAYDEVESELRKALMEKMLIDYDYLPLPSE